MGNFSWPPSQPVVDLASVYSTVPTSRGYRDYVEAHLRELVDRYRPSILWNDIALPPAFSRDEVLVDYLERVPDGVINDRMRVVPKAVARGLRHQPIRWLANSLGRRAVARGGVGHGGVPYFADYATPEYTAQADIRSHKWEACRGFGHSFGFNRAETEQHLLRPSEVVHGLVDAVSKNGNLLLSVGPRGEDGVVPDLQSDRLRELGDWLKVNGDAIYGTRPWTRAEGRTDTGHEVRFTQARGALYAIVLGDPIPGPVVIGRVPTPGPVELLGHGPLSRREDQSCLRIEWPSGVSGVPAHVLRIATLR
jgi:alpha-L-fucosidase